MILNEKPSVPTLREQKAVKSMPVAAASVSVRNPLRPQSAAPGQAEIAKKAYEIWLLEGREDGQDQKHWFEAEQQLRQN